MKQEVILVAGGAGFIGSNLVRQLVHKGNRVVVIDNLSTGSWDNIDGFVQPSDFIVADVEKTSWWDSVLKLKVKVKEIYHLASPASPPYFTDHPRETFDSNVAGTQRLLELAETQGAKFLFASTSEIYGDPIENKPFKETDWGHVNPMGERSCYDEAKRAGEALCYMWKDYVDIRVARIFNTYGVRMSAKDGRVITNFITCAQKGSDLKVYGNGKQTRSFTYVDDTVAGLIKLMAYDGEHKHTPFNIGRGLDSMMTIEELAFFIIDELKSESQISYLPLPADDPKWRCPDTSKSREVLGFEARINIIEGVKRTAKWLTLKY